MVIRRNHMHDVVLPNYMARIPTITYICPIGHKIKLRYDLVEDKDVEQFVYCGQEDHYYPLSDCEVRYPRSTRRADRVMRGKGISEEYDRAIIKQRIVNMLVIGQLTQVEVAMRLGITQQRVSQVANEVSNMLSDIVLDGTMDVDTTG